MSEDEKELVLINQLELSILITQSQKCVSIRTDAHNRHALDLIGDLTSKRGEAIKIAKALSQPYEDALEVIKTALRKFDPIKKEMERLRNLVADYEGMKRRAQIARAEELEKLANEKQNAAYAAKTKAKRLELLDEALQAREKAAGAITPTPGVAVRLGWEPTLVDWVEVANTNRGLLHPPSINMLALQDAIKALGKEVHEDSFPGIKLTPTNKITLR